MLKQAAAMGHELEMTNLMTGALALLFAATFLIGGRVHPLQWLVRERRTYISCGAGMAAAFVFVHLLPELHGAREVFAQSESLAAAWWHEGMAIYFLALLGFLMFYGLDHLRGQLREPIGGEQGEREGEGGGFQGRCRRLRRLRRADVVSTGA